MRSYSATLSRHVRHALLADRKEQLVGLLMIQERVAATGRDFENAAMQPIVE